MTRPARTQWWTTAWRLASLGCVILAMLLMLAALWVGQYGLSVMFLVSTVIFSLNHLAVRRAAAILDRRYARR